LTLLRDVLDEAAAGLPEIELSVAPDGSLGWSRAGQPFAALSADGTAAEFALDVPVAAAAARTPDVAPSGRGPGWVRFSPTVLDDHGVDRARAWSASAYRRTSRG
jgi:hypothetical protein